MLTLHSSKDVFATSHVAEPSQSFATANSSECLLSLGKYKLNQPQQLLAKCSSGTFLFFRTVALPHGVEQSFVTEIQCSPLSGEGKSLNHHALHPSPTTGHCYLLTQIGSFPSQTLKMHPEAPLVANATVCVMLHIICLESSKTQLSNRENGRFCMPQGRPSVCLAAVTSLIQAVPYVGLLSYQGRAVSAPTLHQLCNLRHRRAPFHMHKILINQTRLIISTCLQRGITGDSTLFYLSFL